MSKYVINQSCKICHDIEKPLCTMSVGDTRHHVCYDCMAEFVCDLVDFAKANLTEEIENKGFYISKMAVREPKVEISKHDS